MQHAMPKFSEATFVHKPLKIHRETLTATITDGRAFWTSPMPLRENFVPLMAKNCSLPLSIVYRGLEMLRSVRFRKSCFEINKTFKIVIFMLPWWHLFCCTKAFGYILVPVLARICKTSLKTGKFPLIGRVQGLFLYISQLQNWTLRTTNRYQFHGLLLNCLSPFCINYSRSV